MNPHANRIQHDLALLIVALLAACDEGSGSSSSYTMGGTVTGLSGTLILQNNSGDNLSVSGNNFTFATSVASGGAYNVTILTQPDKQRCFVNAGAGTASANISNITVTCASQKGGSMQGISLNLIPTVSTPAGAPVGADGTSAAARLYYPRSVVSVGGNLYVADTYDHKIRKIEISTGAVTTLAGSGIYGAADGIGAVATLNNPGGIATDGTNLYVADTSNNKIRKIVIATGVVSSITGIANTTATTGEIDGPVTAATFYNPYNLTSDGDNLYVVDTYNRKIRKIVLATSEASSLTGTPNTAGAPGTVDGAGTTAKFIFPLGITADGEKLFVADYLTIRQIQQTAEQSQG